MSTTKTVQVLRAMRVRLEDPKRWTQHANARDANGRSVFASDEQAVCWCLDGAAIVEVALVGHVTPTLRSIEVLLTKSAEEQGSDAGFVHWQDDSARTHAEMLTLLDRAIEIAAATS